MRNIILCMMIFILSSCGKTALDSKISTESSALLANNSVCPSGYIIVPKLSPYTAKDFCVMKYEAKQEESGKAISKAAGTPWVRITRADARAACKAQGIKFDMISNEEWQTIARNIAGTASNWSFGSVANRELNIGFWITGETILPASEDDINGNCYGTTSTCSSATWSPNRRTHNISNGNVIWDFGGNVIEWVTNDYTSSVGSNDHIANMNNGDIRQINYGAESSTICNSPTSSPFCGMGEGNISGTSYGTMTRGLNGIFSIATSTIFEPSQAVGFRCVFYP